MHLTSERFVDKQSGGGGANFIQLLYNASNLFNFLGIKVEIPKNVAYLYAIWGVATVLAFISISFISELSRFRLS